MLAWSSEYQIGIAQIDREHEVLFSHLQNFHNAHTRNASKEDLFDTLRDVIRYVEFHFRSEENIMEALAFPGLEEIRAQHSSMSESLSEIVFAFEIDIAKPDKVEEFLSSWFHDHILKEDKKIADFKSTIQTPE
jgi:hemerythrin